MDNIKCQYANHQEKKIVSVCLHKDCTQKIFCCLQCLNQFHGGHDDKFIEVGQFNEFILNQFKSPQSSSDAKNQIIQGLEYLCELIDSFKKIVQERLQEIKGQNLQEEYLKKFGDIQLGIESSNEFIENILKYVEVNNGVLTQKKQNECQLNWIEIKHISTIKVAQESLEKLIQSFNISPDPKKLTFCKIPIELIGNAIESVTSQDGQNIYFITRHNTIHVWNTKSKLIIKTINHYQRLYIMAVSYNNQYLAFSDYEHNIILYNLKSDKNLGRLKQCKNWINQLVFSHNDQYLLSGGSDNKLRIWNVVNRMQIHVIYNVNHCKMIVISPNNKFISYICEKQGQISIWEFSTLTKLLEVDTNHKSGYGLCSTADSSTFISSGSEGIIKIWKLEELQNKKKSFTLIKQIKAANNIIHTVILTPDEYYIISTCNDEGKIMIHERKSGKLIQNLEFREQSECQIKEYYNFPANVQITNDMSTLVSTNYTDGIKVWTRE